MANVSTTHKTKKNIGHVKKPSSKIHYLNKYYKEKDGNDNSKQFLNTSESSVPDTSGNNIILRIHKGRGEQKCEFERPCLSPPENHYTINLTECGVHKEFKIPTNPNPQGINKQYVDLQQPVSDRDYRLPNNHVGNKQYVDIHPVENGVLINKQHPEMQQRFVVAGYPAGGVPVNKQHPEMQQRSVGQPGQSNMQFTGYQKPYSNADQIYRAHPNTPNQTDLNIAKSPNPENVYNQQEVMLNYSPSPSPVDHYYQSNTPPPTKMDPFLAQKQNQDYYYEGNDGSLSEKVMSPQLKETDISLAAVGGNHTFTVQKDEITRQHRLHCKIKVPSNIISHIGGFLFEIVPK